MFVSIPKQKLLCMYTVLGKTLEYIYVRSIQEDFYAYKI